MPICGGSFRSGPPNVKRMMPMMVFPMLPRPSDHDGRLIDGGCGESAPVGGG